MSSAMKVVAVVVLMLAAMVPASTSTRPDFNGTWVAVKLPEFLRRLAAKIEKFELRITIKQSETLISVSQELLGQSPGKSTMPAPDFKPVFLYPDGRDIRHVEIDRSVTSTRTTWEGDVLVKKTVTMKGEKPVSTHTSRWSLTKAGLLEMSTTIENNGRPATELMVLKRKQ